MNSLNDARSATSSVKLRTLSVNSSPVKLHFSTSNNFSCVRLEIPEGKLEMSLLSKSSKLSSVYKVDTSSGRVPARLFDSVIKKGNEWFVQAPVVLNIKSHVHMIDSPSRIPATVGSSPQVTLYHSHSFTPSSTHPWLSTQLSPSVA